MRDDRWDGTRVLIVEDELLVAINLETILTDMGCVVLGPVGSLGGALTASEKEAVDLAILDINLRGEQVYPAAERLLARGIPIVFCSGYTDEGALPQRFQSCVKLGKPYAASEIRTAMEQVLRAGEDPQRSGNDTSQTTPDGA